MGGHLVSVIATVKNEYGNLPAWLSSLERQTRQPDEYVFVDGGSVDGTWELLQGWSPGVRVECLRASETSIARGRNIAISRSQGDIIVVTDAGTAADPDWLELLVEPFADSTIDVSGGFFRPAGVTIWQRSLGATTLPDVDEVVSDRFLPSSRSVAFRQSWFDMGIRYPEWLDYCEDLIWDMSMRRAGARFAFVPEAVVSFEPRPTWRAYWRQYFHYARGDGKSGLFPRRHAIRYLTYAGAIAVIGRHRPLEVALAGALGCGYLSGPVQRLWRRDRADGWPPVATLQALPLLPIQRFIGDLAKMAGYPRGLVWRVRRYGMLGPRVTWRQIRPDGYLWRPGSMTTKTPPSRASRVSGSQAVSPTTDDSA